MANSIAKRQNDLVANLDLVYKAEAKTAVLTANPALVQDIPGMAGSVRIAKRSVDGYGDYGRQNGGSAYPAGDVTLAWETHTMAVDRGVSLTVDRLDNDESGDNAFLSINSLAGQLEREKGVPELDAYRFAKMAGTSGILTTTAAVLSASTVKAAVDAGLTAMMDAEVPMDGAVIFMTPTVYSFFKNASLFTYNLESNATNGAIDTRITSYDGHRVVMVPQSRFYTAIDLNDGSASFGYAKASGGVDINFMIVQPSSVLPVNKLDKIKYFTPDENQNGDSHLVQARKYYDLFVLENKVTGIYLHKSTS